MVEKGLPLRTRDRKQAELFERETRRRAAGEPPVSKYGGVND